MDEKALHSEIIDLTIKIRGLEPWKCLSDDDIFGIEYSKGIAYCSVIGHTMENRGVVFHLGDEGFRGLLTTLEGPENPVDALMTWRALSVSFDDRRLLKEKDLEIIRDSGRKFRGRGEWPVFKSFIPGYVPWYISDEEEKVLLELLSLFVIAFNEITRNRKRVSRSIRGVNVLEHSKNGNKWRIKKPDLSSEITVPVMQDRTFKKLYRVLTRVQKVLEMSYEPLSSPVREGKDRPFIPIMVFMADRDSKMVLAYGLARIEDLHKVVADVFLESIERVGIPTEIHVDREDVHFMLVETVERFGSKIFLGHDLEAVEEVKRSFSSMGW
ncbi:MAG: hypothetical protein JXA22_00570 [Candidatus Thermoplasmatota archaeon]|nr:hypothetical protein [Candidatus Thermoplasmatota archaeon]